MKSRKIFIYENYDSTSTQIAQILRSNNEDEGENEDWTAYDNDDDDDSCYARRG